MTAPKQPGCFQQYPDSARDVRQRAFKGLQRFYYPRLRRERGHDCKAASVCLADVLLRAPRTGRPLNPAIQA